MLVRLLCRARNDLNVEGPRNLLYYFTKQLTEAVSQRLFCVRLSGCTTLWQYTRFQTWLEN